MTRHPVAFSTPFPRHGRQSLTNSGSLFLFRRGNTTPTAGLPRPWHWLHPRPGSAGVRMPTMTTLLDRVTDVTWVLTGNK